MNHSGLNMNLEDLPPRRIRFRSKQAWQCRTGAPAQVSLLNVARERWAADFCACNLAPGHYGGFQVLTGRGWFRDDHGTVALRAGSVVWHAPDRARAFWCAADAPMDVIIVSASGEPLDALTRHCLDARSGALQLHQPDLALALLRQLQTCCAAGGSEVGLQAGHLLQAWLYQLRFDRLGGGQTSAAQSLWWHSRRLLQQGQVASIAELAERLEISASYLARIYRRFDSSSPRERLQEARLQQAQAALSDSDNAIVAIAQDAGFADQSAFGKAFRRFCGSTPAEYRRRFRR
jgi:AraC-like DNA-binding protein